MPPIVLTAEIDRKLAMPTNIAAQPLIIGAGPTGLAAALFLAQRGITARIIDRAGAPSATSRAQVVNPRALELLDSTGVTAAILAEGRAIRGVRFYEDWRPLATLDFDRVPSRFAMTAIPQARTETILAEALARHGIMPERGVALEAFEQDDRGISATLSTSDGKRQASAPLMLGADGAHSYVRGALGITFGRHGFPEPWPLYDIDLDDPLDLDHAHVNLVEGAMVFLLAIRPGLWRIFGDMPDVLDRLPAGTTIGEPTWTSEFHIGDRLAERAVEGRVALAGDAAHIHSPIGARGMNLGIEDAYVFAACATDALAGDGRRLADYGRLRHRVHAKVVARMDRLTTLARGRPDWIGLARHYLLPALTGFRPLAHAMQRFITGTDEPTDLH